MISLVKNNCLGLLFLSLFVFQSDGQTISQAVKNIDSSPYSLTTEECVSVKLVVDYTTASGGFSAASPTYYLTNGETKVLQVNIPVNAKGVIGPKKLIFYTDSHSIIYPVQGSGTILENYDYIESCVVGIPNLFWTLTLGGSSTLVTYFIHQ